MMTPLSVVWNKETETIEINGTEGDQCGCYPRTIANFTLGQAESFARELNHAIEQAWPHTKGNKG